MVFSNITFLYIFLPIFFILYFVVPSLKYKNYILCVFSLIFYFVGEPKYILLMLFVSYVNYFAGIKIEKGNDDKKKVIFIFAIIFNILVLFIFKYVNNIIGLLFNLKILNFKTNILLPIGISFYIFQSISYVADVYLAKVTAQKKYINLLIYISMFPQLIAGPIVRYDSIENKLTSRNINVDKVYYGIERLIIGLSKKVLISNQLSILVNSLLNICNSKISLVLGILFYMLQLYFDFSGYSDMAIGMGSILGFDFPENFNYPFMSLSLTSFWRKWHMTLTKFFKDYVYIPLGGNKKHKYLNIFIVWILTGIWHGATLNYLFWGVFLGIMMIIEKRVIDNIKIKVPFVLRFLYIFAVLYISFVLFYFDNFMNMKNYILSIKQNPFINYETYTIIINNIFLVLLSIILLIPIKIKIKNKTLLFFKTIFLVLLLAGSTIMLIGETNNPFMYFRF